MYQIIDYFEQFRGDAVIESVSLWDYWMGDRSARHIYTHSWEEVMDIFPENQGLGLFQYTTQLGRYRWVVGIDEIFNIEFW